MKVQLSAVYPITDTQLSRLSVPDQIRQMAAGGARVVQLRDKAASSRDFFAAAVEAVRIAKENDVRLIVNDRVDVAMLTGADGVHLGQDDLSPIQARRLLGENAIIGYSTHTLAQAAEAVTLPIDYVAFGPVFHTSTKANPDPVTGLVALAAIKELAGDLPVVAIGGIDDSNFKAVLAAGATSAAMIGAILRGPKPIQDQVRHLLDNARREDKDVLHR